MPSASRKSKKSAAAPVPVPVLAATPAPVLAAAPEPIVVTSSKKKKQVKSPPAPSHPEPETDHAPTFPNIVILKQTEHNYIVKHNIDPKANIATGGGARARAGAGCDDDIAEDTDDLVTPNQIHKNHINKKRGRKPKAGLISNTSSNLSDITEVPNIILHLKCHMSDLKTNDSISNYGYTPAIEEVESYSITNIHSSDIVNLNTEEDIDTKETNDYEYNDEPSNSKSFGDETQSRENNMDRGRDLVNSNNYIKNCVSTHQQHASRIDAPVLYNDNGISGITTTTTIQPNRNINIIQERNSKEIMKKINRLKYSFHNSEPLQSKINHKSACFWDTCDFDSQTYYIPVMIVNDIFQVYGCFCSSECAVAFLLKEPIDTSTKFERLHLIQLLYGNPNGRGIKPAPNPYYLLDKYYGNLTIQEYRQLLKGPQLIHIVNKPLTHILPELYEDNNDFLVNSKVIPTNNLKLKKRYKTMVVQNSDV
jgi:hypothetical protein